MGTQKPKLFESLEFITITVCAMYCVTLSAWLLAQDVPDYRAAFPCVFALTLMEWHRLCSIRR
jgi:hypothetical protein